MSDDQRSAATTDTPGVLSDDEVARIHAWWRAANYLSVGQIYLMDNPLLREPLLAEHVKPRLLGHWGTTPGLNFVYAHLNRAITARDLDVMYVMGPGHGGPGPVAAAWLEGTYSEVYADITQDAAGMRRLFTQFSFPGGIPSHARPSSPKPSGAACRPCEPRTSRASLATAPSPPSTASASSSATAAHGTRRQRPRHPRRSPHRAGRGRPHRRHHRRPRARRRAGRHGRRAT